MSSAAIEEDKMANLWTTIRWEEGGEEKRKERKDVSVVENNNKKEKLVPRFNKSRTTAAAVSVGRLALLHYCAKWPNKGDNQ